MSTATVHIASIQPTCEERNAFQEFHLKLLANEAVWHPSLVNFICRWMHRYTLYNCHKTPNDSMFKLVDAFIMRTTLPRTEKVRKTMAAKCISLVQDRASKWISEHLLLVPKSGRPRKCRALKDAWTAYKVGFAKSEITMLEELCLEVQAAQQRQVTKEVPHISPHDSEAAAGQADKSTTVMVRCQVPVQVAHLKLIGKLIVPDHTQQGTWFILHIDNLMNRSLKEFYDWFTELRTVKGRVHELTFEIIDIFSTRLSTEASKPPGWSISRDDETSFEALKQLLFSSFSAAFKEEPGLSVFRIVVTPNPIDKARTGRGGFNTVGSLMKLRPLEPRLTQVIPKSAQPFLVENSGPAVKAYSHNSSIQYGPPIPKKVSSSGMSQYPPPIVVVRIQVNAYGMASDPYELAVLGPEVNNVDFFGWFAKETGYAGSDWPPQLRFSFRDVLPRPKENIIPRGNEEYFEYMKNDITPMCGRSAKCMPGLAEFMILVTVPGWVVAM